MSYNCITILGPTASGKTKLACQLASVLKGEIISADSRQVYKHLNIGTGKDLNEYHINGKAIPYHLIDMIEPGEQYYLHHFINDLQLVFKDIKARHQLPIICGGSGLYLDVLHKDFSLTQIKENIELRNELELVSTEDLIKRLKNYPKPLWQHVDLNSKKRIIRAIEICESKSTSTQKEPSLNEQSKIETVVYNPLYLGININIEERKQKISKRLIERLNNGLIEEVQDLIKLGLSHERLQKLGLEYKFVSMYLSHKINKEELFQLLQTAIFQFAKRQLTWYRKMEKEGIHIHWLPYDNSYEVAIQILATKNFI